MGLYISLPLSEKMGNLLFSSKISDLLPGNQWSRREAWPKQTTSRPSSRYTACSENEIELTPLPEFSETWSDVSSSYCDKSSLEDTIYVDIQNGQVLLNEKGGPCLPELISQGLLGQASGGFGRRQTLQSFEERNWRQSFPQTMVFAVELYYNMHIIRKQDLRELKLLQKMENKQYQDLVVKAQSVRQQEERRYQAEEEALKRSYEADIESLIRQQKQQVEKAEATQETDIKAATKRIRQDQERDGRMFRENLRQELKLLKQEVDLLPKEARKDAMRRRREEKEAEHREKEKQFLEDQQESFDKSLKRISEQHREKVALLERQFLQQKQQLLRSREAAIWEIEERHLHEKHQLLKRQMKDLFFMKRHQMYTRHEKELDQVRRINARKEDEVLQRQALEKKRLPKIQKGEMKTRAQIFKQSLRISMVQTPEEERDKIRQFEENEKKRVKAEQLRQELKHRKQWEELTAKNQAQLQELDQLQAEKRKMLMDQENHKLRELDELAGQELQEWRSMLQPRKRELEEEFRRQREEQEQFYGRCLANGGDTAGDPRNSTISSRSSQAL